MQVVVPNIVAIPLGILLVITVFFILISLCFYCYGVISDIVKEQIETKEKIEKRDEERQKIYNDIIKLTEKNYELERLLKDEQREKNGLKNYILYMGQHDGEVLASITEEENG